MDRTTRTRRLGARGALALVATAVVAAAACTTLDTSVIDQRLNQAVAPKTAPATGCVEACGIGLLVTSRTAAGADVVKVDKKYGTWTGTEQLPVASATKWLTSTVIMSLVDDGLLALTDTVGQFFPAYAGTEKGSITLAQLLSHTSGMAGLNVPGDACLSNGSLVLGACAESILTRALIAPPGTTFSYGSMSFQVAGRMAELASGKLWGALLQERLLVPLGMANTKYGGTTNPRLDGGAIMTIGDLDRFLSMIQGNGTVAGVQILTPAAVAAMEVVRTDGLTRTYNPAPNMDGYGIGVWVTRAEAGSVIASPGLLGSFPMIDRGRCYRSVLQPTSSSGANARAQMAVVKPELDRQLSC